MIRETLHALAAWRGVRELTKLSGLRTLGAIDTDEVVRTLARSRHLRRLEVLELDCFPPYSDAAIATILDSPCMVNLKRLHLGSEDEEAELSEAMLERFRARFGTQHPSE